VKVARAVVRPEVVRARLASQLLTGTPAGSPEEVVGRILAVQAQDPRGARLAVRARSSGLAAADVDHAFSDDRSLVITWLNRGTLHLVRTEDYWWLHELCAHRYLSWTHRRLKELGVSLEQAERSVELIVHAIEREGPRTRAEIAERLVAAGVPTGGQAIYHQVGLASDRGLIVRGPMRGREQCYVLVRDWLGDPPPFDRDRALAELARRYLAGHGPASADDLAYWTGFGLRDARAALRAIASEIDERPDGLVELRVRRAADVPPVPVGRLLGPFDPLLHGWRSRAEILGPHQSLVTMNGMFKATLLAGGRATGTWRMPAGRVVLEPFEPLSADVLAALEADARAVERFFGS
jgi:uncharacterized protein YcaQ